MANQQDDDIPTLEDVLRPGNANPADRRAGGGPARGGTALSQAEIEAIAARVIKRETARIETAVARAITRALELKARGQLPVSEDNDKRKSRD